MDDTTRAPEPALTRLRAYLKKNRLRLLRYSIGLFVLYAVVDLVSSNFQDTELVFPLAPMLANAATRPSQVSVSVLDEDGALMSHTELRLPPDLENLHFTASVPPGEYSAIIEMRGVLAHEGHFTVPTEGALRVNLAARP